MSISHQNNHNEFDWEREIRRDERRISRYYRELMYCLDLPGEEEIINEQLADKCGDPVPAGVPPCNDLLRGRRLFEHEEEEEEDTLPPHKQYSAFVNRIDRLAVEWLAFSSRIMDNKFFVPAGMGIACSYSKFLSRAAHFSNADPLREQPLRTTLAKRTLADLNELVGAFIEISDMDSNIKVVANRHINELSQIRERLTDILLKKTH